MASDSESDPSEFLSSGDIAPLVPDAVVERITSCVRFVYAATGIELDFSHETLPILDHYAASARAGAQERPETIPLLTEAMGAYFGLVLTREFGALWRASSQDTHDWLIFGQNAFIAINPIAVAYDALLGTNQHAGPSSELILARDEQQAIEQRLASLPEVSEDDFFTFGTRFDALHIAVEALRAGMVASGNGDVSFEWGDYEDELRRQGRAEH